MSTQALSHALTLVANTDGDGGWRASAACLDVDPETFFDPDRQTKALEVCRRCPVREDCLAMALERRESEGVFGGTTEVQRARLARRTGLDWPSVHPALPVRPATCNADGCDEPHSALGWCSKHYKRWTRYGTVEAQQARRPAWEQTAALDVLEAVADHHQVDVDDLTGRATDRQTVAARQDAMVRLRDLGLSLPHIGRLVNRHHTTVLHAVQRAERVPA